MEQEPEKHASKISKLAEVARTCLKNKRKKTVGGYFDRLPCEILHEIALLLPFTSIISLRRSSKFWYNVLKDPKFVDMHSTRELQKPTGYLFTFFYKDSQGNPEVHIVEESQGRFSNSKIFEYSTKWESYDRSKFQSSGGLMCVYSNQSNSFRIFNPNIAEEVQVRDVPIFKKCRHWWFFCYSPSTKEYKILKLGVLLRNNFIESTVGAICTLGSNIWRGIQKNIPRQFFDTFTECRGNLFWIKKRRLISFDITSEEFHEIPGPLRKQTRVYPGKDSCLGLMTIRLINMGHTIGCIEDYRLWVLEDVTKGIWINKHRFSYPWKYKNLHVAGVLENGSFFGFEECSRTVFIHDLRREVKIIDVNTVKKIGKGLERIAYVAPHVRSLVSPVRIMEMGNKQTNDPCDVNDISRKRKWVLDTLKLDDDATEDDLFHRMYEVLNLQPHIKGRPRKFKKMIR